MKVKLTIMLDDEVAKKVKDLAKKEERPISTQINKMLKEYMSGK